MSFQPYIDNITAKTGKSPEQFREDAIKQGSVLFRYLDKMQLLFRSSFSNQKNY